MSRYIAIDGCKKCPHRHYYSVELYECLKYGTVLPASHILDIPEWCPLPKLPTPASAPETRAQPTCNCVEGFCFVDRGGSTTAKCKHDQR